jgi:UDP-N-acetylglucosamine acyltransferase
MSIHPTALVGRSARLSPGVVVGPFAVVEDDVVIGAGTELRAHAVVKRYTTLGEGNAVHEGAVLGGEPQDLAFQGGETRLVIGNDNRIREGVTIHRGTRPGSVTQVGSGCFFLAGVHIAHDNRIADRVIVANGSAFGGYVEVGERAFVSAGVLVHQFCRVGSLAMVGGNSTVIQDALPFMTTMGSPARAYGLNRVGLTRAGVPAAQVRALKEGYRLLLRANLRQADALERMAALQEPLVDEVIAFVRSARRGFAHAARGHRDDDS